MREGCLLILAFLAFASVDSFTVLGILPFGSNSHFAIGNSILQALHKSGHQVTAISPYPQKKAQKNYTDIDVSSARERFKRGWEVTKAHDKYSTFFHFPGVPNAFNLSKMGVIDMVLFLYQFGYDLVEGCMGNANIIQFMESKPKFDVCIVENFNADAFIVRTLEMVLPNLNLTVV